MKTIVLIDWHWLGHHLAYYRKLLLNFHRCGVKVLGLCPAEAIPLLIEWMAAQKEYPELSKNVDLIPIQLFHPKRHLPEWLRGRYRAFLTFGSLAKQIRSWERENDEKISLVFFAAVYEQDFEWFQQTRSIFGYRWSGIHMQSRGLRLPGTMSPDWNHIPRPEMIFNSPTLSSIGLLDEGNKEAMAKLTGDKPVIVFPDFTDVTVEGLNSRHSLASKMTSFAAGRPIVVCLGRLKKTKGIIQLCKAAEDPRLKDVCFFFGGELDLSRMTRMEQREILNTLENNPNILTHLYHLVDEATINNLIAASDMVFAAYTDFPNSSNMMTKAAYFKRPIIVSDGHLMAERVRAYGTGKIVPEGDVQAIVGAIKELSDSTSLANPNYEDFYQKHSESALLEALSEVLQISGCCDGKPGNASARKS